MSSSPSAPAQGHWAQGTEAGAVAGMWFLYWVNRHFGRWPFRVLLIPVTLYFLARRRLARRASREYFERLESVTGALGHRPTWRDTFRHVRLFSETVLDKALAVSGQFRFDHVQVEGREVMLQSLAAGQGGLLLTSHMGCLEVLRSAGESKGLKLNLLVHTKHAEQFNSVLKRLNPDAMLNLLQVTDFGPATAAMLADRVAQGEFVVIAGDRVPVTLDGSGKVVWAPFLGKPAPFPAGPWVLAAALKCQVIFIATLHEGESYRVRFSRFRERVELPRARRAEALTELVAEYARALEGLCRESPYDWFNFYSFWEGANAEGPVAGN